MKGCITLLLVLVSVVLPVFAQPSKSRPTGPKVVKAVDADEKLEEVLVNLEKQSWDAWKRRDGRFFQEFLSDDHVEVGFGGPTNKSTVVAGVNSPNCVVKDYAVNEFRVTRFDPDVALLTYRAEQNTTCNGVAVPSPAWVSSLYARRNGRWLNALYQQTQIIRRQAASGQAAR